MVSGLGLAEHKLFEGFILSLLWHLNLARDGDTTYEEKDT